MRIKLILSMTIISLASFSLSSAMNESPDQMLLRALKVGDVGAKLAEKAIKLGANINFIEHLCNDRERQLELFMTALKRDTHRTILMILCERATLGHKVEKIFQVLLNSGINVNLQVINGNTALIYAINNNDRPESYEALKSYIELLLESGADINIKNKNGETALDIAKKTSKKDIIDILEAWPKTLKKRKEKIKEEVGQYLLTDLTNIVSEYYLPIQVEVVQKEKSEIIH